MKRSRFSIWVVTLGTLLIRAQAQTTAFTYQGRLLNGAQPATGLYDFQFRLMDAAFGGNGVHAPLATNGVMVSTGLFSAALDFGSSNFDGSARWLEVSVRTNGSQGGYTTLQPAQPLTATPYALRASSAGTASIAAALGDGGAGLTDVPGSSIQPHSISANQIAAETDSAYRATDTNAVQAVGDARWASKTWLNVKDFGALGNGVDDDTAALGRAWSQFVSVGGTLYFPPGTYRDSATHVASGFRSGEPVVRDGRLILGHGSVVWAYTGNSTLLVMSNSVPDIEGIEFANWGAGSNCVYVTGAYSKWSIRNCFFNGWTITNAGALVLDDVDSAVLSDLQFYLCGTGVGLGYHCGNLKADLMFRNCGTCVAVGVPTPSYPGGLRDSKVIRLSFLAAYCDTGVAVDVAGGPVAVEANNWYVSNPIVLGKIAGISTNYYGFLRPVTIENSWFNAGSTINPPVQVYSTVDPSLEIRNCQFDLVATPVAIVKSYNISGDQTSVDWHDSVVTGTAKGMFEDSNGIVLTESAANQCRFLNQAFGIYNSRNFVGAGGSGYVLDVMDASSAGQVARLGLNNNSASFDQFSAGLTIGVNAISRQAVVQVTNADLVVSPPGAVGTSADSGTPGSIRWDQNYLYICVRSNLWKRANLSSW
jgi:hypothetical protein